MARMVGGFAVAQKEQAKLYATFEPAVVMRTTAKGLPGVVHQVDVDIVINSKDGRWSCCGTEEATCDL